MLSVAEDKQNKSWYSIHREHYKNRKYHNCDHSKYWNAIGLKPMRTCLKKSCHLTLKRYHTKTHLTVSFYNALTGVLYNAFLYTTGIHMSNAVRAAGIPISPFLHHAHSSVMFPTCQHISMSAPAPPSGRNSKQNLYRAQTEFFTFPKKRRWRRITFILNNLLLVFSKETGYDTW